MPRSESLVTGAFIRITGKYNRRRRRGRTSTGRRRGRWKISGGRRKWRRRLLAE